jgi:hypothetical protein
LPAFTTSAQRGISRAISSPKLLARRDALYESDFGRV